jgi:hypothetical protein
MVQFIQDIGPYTMVSKIEELKFGTRTFVLVLYGAYNAMGLIGSECNGIAVLDKDNRLVVLDEHCKIDTGYFGPSESQVREFDRIKAMDADSFLIFCNAHPRLRKQIALVEKTKKASKLNLRTYLKLVKSNLSYEPEAKAVFLEQSAKLARMIAGKLGLNEDQYEVRINPGGIAVSGDVILHTDKLYVNFSKSCLGPDQGFMYRSCNGRKDYSGGQNRWMKWEALLDFDRAVASFAAIQTGL